MPKRYDLEKFSNTKNLQTSTALELIMRDVIDGMEEVANMSGFSPNASDCFEILSVDSPENFDDNLHFGHEDKTLTDKTIGEKNSASIIPIKRKKMAAA